MRFCVHVNYRGAFETGIRPIYTEMAALDRVLARLGQCSDMYSDCGMNFSGTQRYLSEVYDIISLQSTGLTYPRSR